MMATLADALVLVTAVWAASRAHTRRLADLAWSGGLALVALAAAVGTLRYAGASSLASLHVALSSFASVVGMPAMTAGLCARPGLTRRSERRALTVGLALLGAALTAIAVLVVGDEGEWRGVPREIGFHVVFASALVCFGRAFELAGEASRPGASNPSTTT